MEKTRVVYLVGPVWCLDLLKRKEIITRALYRKQLMRLCRARNEQAHSLLLHTRQNHYSMSTCNNAGQNLFGRPSTSPVFTRHCPCR